MALLSSAVLCLAACAGPPAGGVQTSGEEDGVPVDASSPPPSTWQACDDESTDPWVANLRNRVTTHDGLARFAARRFGPLVACHGEVTSVFDGVRFGTIELDFERGANLELMTFPPEASRVTLTVASGFPDEDEARQMLKDYVVGIGAKIDWSPPDADSEVEVMIERFESPEAGLNASAELIFVGGKLTALRFSMAP